MYSVGKMTGNHKQYVPDLQKLRRFALIIGLVLISYSLAGVELKQNEPFTPLGLPLVISRPNLVPIALILASVYTAARFFFYGVLIAGTPKRRLEELTQQLEQRVNKVQLAWTQEEIEKIEDIKEALKSVVPSPWSRTHVIDSFGSNLPALEDFLNKLPWKYGVAMFVQNSDYVSPVWVNIVAVYITCLLNFVA